MFKAFEKCSESHAIHDLTIENDEDRVNVYGNLQITKDQAGLKSAQALQAIINQLVSTLENDANLPEKIEIQAGQEIENPFL